MIYTTSNMRVEIVSKGDNLFNIKVKNFGDVYVGTDGTHSAVGQTEEEVIESIKDMLECDTTIPTEELVDTTDTSTTTPTPSQTNAAPLENSREGHPFDLFGGTSWAGKRNGFN
jgi:hypothetical protein